MTKERPILFSKPMVRAILDVRKTHTRRVVKPQPDKFPSYVADAVWLDNGFDGPGFRIVIKGGVASGRWRDSSPYGKPGDRLWVRETYGWLPDGSNADVQDGRWIYRADQELNVRWKPSIHMPRVASRILLEINRVRVERLQDISKADCIAEGMTDLADVHAGWHESYAQLWGNINGLDSWAANLWVWVIEFKRLEI